MKIMPIGRFQKLPSTQLVKLKGPIYLANTKKGFVFAKVTVEKETFPINEETTLKRKL